MPRSRDHFWHPAQRALRRARVAAHAALASCWQRMHVTHETVRLDDVRARLEHYLLAMYGRTIRIEQSAAMPADANWSRRARRRLGLMREHSASEGDELHIRLPVQLNCGHDGIDALDRYRMLAVQHAERIVRGSSAHLAGTRTLLERDLFLLAEAAAVNVSLATAQPGLQAALRSVRAAALQERTMPRRLTHLERRVETMIRSTLGVSADVTSLPAPGESSASAKWAHETARALEAEYAVSAERYYRGVPQISVWGTSLVMRAARATARAGDGEQRVVDASPAPAEPMREATRQMSPSPTSSPDAQVQDVDGLDALENAGAAAGAPRAESDAVSRQRNDRAIDSQPESSDGTPGAGVPDGHSNAAAPSVLAANAVSYRYPEWDLHANAFRVGGAVVREVAAPATSASWADHVLREHLVLVRQARQQFEQLQSVRLRLTRQDSGDDLDLDACVRALVDRHMGLMPDDRVYAKTRPGRRPLAITLLLDMSQSTREVVFASQRVIDVERLAALVAAAALDSLGDEYSMLAFASDGAADVRVTKVKEFDEPNGEIVRQRISALVPDGKTRLGAAVRHATAHLQQRHAAHRLLIILSDGKPNDRDGYFLDYGVEDSRRAVLDARAVGIHPFCITVDREHAAEYMADIFGTTGYLTVQKPSQLPRALLGAVQRLLAH